MRSTIRRRLDSIRPHAATLSLAREARRFAVISDLHLGAPGGPLACTVPTADIIAAGAALAGDHDLVVINGDLYDLDRGTIPLAYHRELERLEEVHLDAVLAFRGPKFVWTAGNHDRVLARVGAAVTAVDVTTPLGRVRVEHGDRFDAPIKRSRVFTSMVTWTNGRVASVPALQPVHRAMQGLDRLLTGAVLTRDEPIAAAASRWLDASGDYAAMVIGHTHAPVLRRLSSGRTLMNPGGSVTQLHALSIDGDARTARLLRFEGGAFETWHEAAL